MQHVLLQPSGSSTPTYSRHRNSFCPGQDELGSGKGNHTREVIKTVRDCEASCSDVDICISFEWEEKTLTCKRSATCTTWANVGSTAVDFAGVDLYVKNNPPYAALTRSLALTRSHVSCTTPLVWQVHTVRWRCLCYVS